MLLKNFPNANLFKNKYSSIASEHRLFDFVPPQQSNLHPQVKCVYMRLLDCQHLINFAKGILAGNESTKVRPIHIPRGRVLCPSSILKVWQCRRLRLLVFDNSVFSSLPIPWESRKHRLFLPTVDFCRAAGNTVSLSHQLTYFTSVLGFLLRSCVYYFYLGGYFLFCFVLFLAEYPSLQQMTV